MGQLIRPSRTAQYPLVKEFTFNFNDFVVDAVDLHQEDPRLYCSRCVLNRAWSDKGSVANTISVDALPLPPGAVIVGGEVIVETAYAGSTAATVSLGIAGSLTTLANAVDMKTAGRTALALTSQLLANSGQNLRATIAYTVANATAGKVRVRVEYTVDGRSQEVQAA